MVQAVTFDFWNTVMWEQPGSLREKRLEVWGETLAKLGVRVETGQLESAHDAAHQEYVDSWIAGRQFQVQHAVEHMVERLDSDLAAEAKQALASGFSEAGRRATVQPCEGVRECLGALRAADVRTAIICDIGLTPSPVVVELLDRHGVGRLFDLMVFSDEVGDYKPAVTIFEHALAGLGGIRPQQSVHVGDRRRTDVAGALAAGMTAVRYNGVYEDEAQGAPDADIVLTDLNQLPQLLGLPG
jgi:putative hydrolase of the HAD superfamily